MSVEDNESGRGGWKDFIVQGVLVLAALVTIVAGLATLLGMV